jgi:isoleucyl-tRNA synthetase
MMTSPEGKGDAAKREEEVLAFWKEKQIFEKSLAKHAPNGEFVFYDGPPFATGLPHTGSMLSSIIKDVVPRYKTMRGYRVRRRWGWDCHGLPIESLIEKRLNLKTKKDILDLGIDKFNEAARASVLEFEHEWEKYVDRVGRWVDFKNSYKTMDNSYIESVWWALKKLHEKALLYEGRRVLMYCPHCETPLAKAEIAMDHTYKDVTEEAVTVRFRVNRPTKYGLPERTSLLAWTTTPWTLPGNVALAVNPNISYILVPEADGMVIVAKDRFEILRGGPKPKVMVDMGKEYKGSELVGMEYEPLYDIPAMHAHTGKKYVVVPADFVSIEEGTGIVHTAVMYGEDDFMLGQKEGLPMVQLLGPDGVYNSDAPEFVRGKYIKDAEKDIKGDLEQRQLLFEKKNHTHSYPHCYRCGTPLIYNAVPSWFIAIQKVKQAMLAENEKVTWVPEHLKHGRFKNIAEAAPDWTISRNRFWASPLPVWREKNGSKVMIVGSLAELKQRAKKSGNRYFIMRHGEADSNITGIVNSDKNAEIHLTEQGVAASRAATGVLKDTHVDVIYASPFVRTRETAEIVAQTLGIAKEAIVYDERLSESGFGVLSGKPLEEYRAAFPEKMERFSHAPSGGETYSEIKARMMSFLLEREATDSGKNVLIISHGTPLWLLSAATRGLSKQEFLNMREAEYPQPGVITELSYAPMPVNAEYELDLHRPYTDSIVLVDEAGKEYERTPEVVDCWVESGAMPFAEYHYPFENQQEFEKHAPGDFIAEYIAQTRTWFYYMHAMGVLLFDRLAFRSVVSTGTILAADGSKMSKSKGNYTDPLLVMDRYGADALRFHLLGSVVMQAEDLNFRDDDVRTTGNAPVGMLWNCFKFYELYKAEYDGTTTAAHGTHVLDKWVLARLNAVIGEVTAAMDAYDTPRACRILKAFVDEYSTWYVRRSRERVKSADARDKQHALATQREVLLTLARLIAPIMPFLAESVYRGVGGGMESVHLEAWPTLRTPGVFERLFGGNTEKERIQQMEKVRSFVSQALEARDKAGIKVRQPLLQLTVKSRAWKGSEALGRIIAEEVNVKRVVFETGVDEAVVLDTNMTPELKEEGALRELIRTIQDGRKKGGLKPQDAARVAFTGTSDTQVLVQKYSERIKKETNIQDISFTAASAQEGTASLTVTVEKM